jgi:hypothetical protein
MSAVVFDRPLPSFSTGLYTIQLLPDRSRGSEPVDTSIAAVRGVFPRLLAWARPLPGNRPGDPLGSLDMGSAKWFAIVLAAVLIAAQAPAEAALPGVNGRLLPSEAEGAAV